MGDPASRSAEHNPCEIAVLGKRLPGGNQEDYYILREVVVQNRAALKFQGLASESPDR
jgi:hypothetical protein